MFASCCVPHKGPSIRTAKVELVPNLLFSPFDLFSLCRYLEILQKQRLEFEDLLAKRLREQEHVLAQQYGQALNEKDESIQKVMDTALEAQKRQHEQEKKAFEAAKAVELNLTKSLHLGADLVEHPLKV